LRRDQPNSSVRGSMLAKQRPPAVENRIQWSGVMCARTSTARPVAWIVRSASSSMPIARG
jgi:hypothetical protein